MRDVQTFRPAGRRRHCGILLALLAVLVTLAACSPPRPAPVVYKGYDNSRRQGGPLGAIPEYVAVSSGDSVYSIARRYNLTMRAVIDANGLKPPHLLKVGQRVFLPKPRLYTVRKGDTLYGISRLYDVDIYSLASSNRIAKPYRIYPGNRLIIPRRGSVHSAAKAQAPSRAPATDQRAASTHPQAGKAQAVQTPQRKARKAAIPEPSPRSSGRFAWPVKGRVISRFGAKKGGLHNDGVNIAVKKGTAVKAAENGVVAYSGNELRGFGNLLLIRHADGYTSAYAHVDKLLVKRGEAVKRGQVIASVGSTGSVSSPQLHFEIRKGVKAVDPLKHLDG